MKAKFRCYCCGKLVDTEFVIVSHSQDTDRPFLVCVKCLRLIEKPRFELRVKIV